LANDRFKPINLSGDEFTRIVTSSTPSLPIIDHPSSVNPLSASLKPLQGNTSEIPKLHVMNYHKTYPSVEYTNRLSLWPSARSAAGRLPHPVTLDWETSCEICLRWRRAWMKRWKM
jgi:hypothetical protein